MSAFAVFLKSQVTRSRVNDLVISALAGRILTADECDTLRGLQELFDGSEIVAAERDIYGQALTAIEDARSAVSSAEEDLDLAHRKLRDLRLPVQR